MAYVDLHNKYYIYLVVYHTAWWALPSWLRLWWWPGLWCPPHKKSTTCEEYNNNYYYNKTSIICSVNRVQYKKSRWLQECVTLFILCGVLVDTRSDV